MIPGTFFNTLLKFKFRGLTQTELRTGSVADLGVQFTECGEFYPEALRD